MLNGCVVLRRARLVHVFPVKECNARALETNVISFWQHFWTVEVHLCLCFGRNDSADPRKVYRCNRLAMPSNDVILLGYRPRSEIQATLNLRRAVSDDRLLEAVREARRQGPVFSMLKLSKTRISVGDSVTVYWDVREQCGANDWIGLFDLGKWTCTFHKFGASFLPMHTPGFIECRIDRNKPSVYSRSSMSPCAMAQLFPDRNSSTMRFQYKQILIPCGAFQIQIYHYISRANIFGTQWDLWGTESERIILWLAWRCDWE